LGFRHLDAAERYRNEAEVGAALKELFDDGTVRREDLFVTTKLWNNNHRPERVKPALQASLDKLGLEAVDLYLVHTPFAFQPGDDQDPRDRRGAVVYDDGVTLEETWAAMETLVDEGLSRAIGLSDIDVARTRKIVETARIKPAVVEVESHPYHPQWDLHELCQAHGIILLAFASLGLLIASRAQTMEGASGLMNLVMLPMWIFSGVFFSASRFPEQIQPLIQALPLTAVINALRAHLAELGIVAAQGREGLKQLLAIIADQADARLPLDARACLIVLAAQLQALHTLIKSIEKRLLVQHRANEASKRLESIPGIGIIGASAIAATVTDPKAFQSGRDFAAWIGLVPRQDSTGGKQKLGPISKQGDRYLRRILVVGAHAVMRWAKQNPGKYPWLTQLLARRPFKVVAIALANKMARVAWALLASGAKYRAPRLAAAT